MWTEHLIEKYELEKFNLSHILCYLPFREIQPSDVTKKYRAYASGEGISRNLRQLMQIVLTTPNKANVKFLAFHLYGKHMIGIADGNHSVLSCIMHANPLLCMTDFWYRDTTGLLAYNVTMSTFTKAAKYFDLPIL